ncbi:Peptide methionine sulfoxide reductase MsrA [Pseudovibrio sp. W64]|uniref:Peptide methionine sulfoxide reductase MsrA n=1 Tax=Pseudovibrio ascidiaceicola TaxID=285279 RepID=A0A1I3X2L3_9HYPH|nr:MULTISPECIES: peptide-methionine (S)-S-oxide reductase MsrA [Pseudovibrio]KZK90758.1 Peptide methionine sulfoxide reductase MsrA [Pseudovibrio sp. W64]KZK91354.1 Peptide methionine sulfoxide reductase MsrA [Pseudovibrio sp. Ad46]KZL26530.1 Peptide methionine sulfoxide reductase MsrA [Pseudovibrio sp. WM33]KZL27191.1 Peptide methionine sulfoxide reductase MsrA [Pseudovibrio sp. Ad37]SFK13833.1 peptide-methionine (S)-S-oxide reductase [Pseudovibrio ascidiaceicola]
MIARKAAKALAVLPLLYAVSQPAQAAETETAIFAGGCFWCIESDFDKIEGVLETTSGYTGGRSANPTYKQVSAGGTGHIEALEVKFDPAKVSYEELLTAFWHSVDPTDAGGQFCDRGESYQTTIFATSPAQLKAAKASKKALGKSGEVNRPIVTPIRTAAPFYDAEDYHQNYYEKNPIRYKFYRYRCGRDQRVKQVWGPNAYKGIPGEH